MSTERFSQIFPQNVLGLDVISGRIYESQFLSDEEQEVFAGFTIKESNKMGQLIKHGKNKTCLAMWMARWKTVQTNSDKKGEVIYLGKNLTDSELF